MEREKEIEREREKGRERDIYEMFGPGRSPNACDKTDYSFTCTCIEIIVS